MEKVEETIVSEEETSDSLENKEEVSKEKKHKKRPRLHEITAENDMKFRGKLSYRHFRILGWTLLVLSQIGLFLRINASINENPMAFGILPQILSMLDDLMPPLFLIAAFSLILFARDGYRRLIIMYAGFALLLGLGFAFVYWHYIVDTLVAFTPTKGKALAESLIFLISGNGYFAFNIFIDLLLCSLLMFFINYTPKVHFQGKKIIIFRLFSLIPILYEIGSIALKISCSVGRITLSPFAYPFLTTKAPMAFLIFIALALFIKFREKHFLKHGKTQEDYQQFQQTNTNSFHFSVFLSVTIAISAVIDFFLLALVATLLISNAQNAEAANDATFIGEQVQLVYKWGFGKTLPLIFIIPFIMFFDYRKTYKNKLIDIIIPVVGVGLVAFAYLEGGFSTVKAFFIHMNKQAEERQGQEELEALIAFIKHK